MFILQEYIGNTQPSKSNSFDSTPSEVLTRSMSSCSSLCGGDMVVEEHKEVIRSLSKHVLYGQSNFSSVSQSMVLSKNFSLPELCSSELF